jgi:uncharacterized protein (TIGR00730 family)
MAHGVEEVPGVSHQISDEKTAAIGGLGLSIAVGCSSYEVPEQYAEPAREFIRLMAAHGYSLLWGASDVGLMHVVATTAREEGAQIFGVTESRFLRHAHRSADELTVVKNLAERKAKLMADSAAFVILAGGAGTLDEITEAVENKKIQKYNHPIVVLNTNNFYEGYRLQMKRMHDEGMMSNPIEDFVYFTESPQEAIDHIQQYVEMDTERTQQE